MIDGFISDCGVGQGEPPPSPSNQGFVSGGHSSKETLTQLVRVQAAAAFFILFVSDFYNQTIRHGRVLGL